MKYTFGSTDTVNTTELVYTNREHLIAGWEDVKFGQIDWRKILNPASVLTDIDPGALAMVYQVRETRGKGAFYSGGGQSVPTVAMSIGRRSIPIAVGVISANFTRDDARGFSMGTGGNLLSELGRAMREAGERHVEAVTFYGESNVSFTGWLAYPGVPIAVAPNGDSGSSLWVDKTPDEIVFDMNKGITNSWSVSAFNHLPDTIFLPGDHYSYIATTRMTDGNDKTILEYVKKNNIFTAQRGQDLTILPIRYLAGAGAGETDRMVVTELGDKANFKMPFPIPFDLLNPQDRNYNTDLFGEYKFGSLNLPYPLSMSYTDGI